MDTLNHENSFSNIDSIQGASVENIDDTDLIQSKSYSSDLDDLPMVLIIKDDDPLYPVFNMDAEDVMKELGIKRSRLTQISGKELRVGRKRIGRYIKPMYRLEDVLNYKNWSRATATHQKSSNMIQEAATYLEESALTLSSKLTSSLKEFKEYQQSSFLELKDQNLDSCNNLYSNISKLTEELSNSFNKASNIHQEFLQNISSSIIENVLDLKKELSSFSSRLQNIENKLCELESLSFQYENILSNFSKLDSFIQETLLKDQSFKKDISKDIRTIHVLQKETQLKEDKIIENQKILSRSMQKKSYFLINKKIRSCLHRKKRSR